MSVSPDTNFFTGFTLASGLVMVALSLPSFSSKSISFRPSTSIRVSLLYVAEFPNKSHCLAPVFSSKFGNSKFLTVPGSIVVILCACDCCAENAANAAAANTIAFIVPNAIL